MTSQLWSGQHGGPCTIEPASGCRSRGGPLGFPVTPRDHSIHSFCQDSWPIPVPFPWSPTAAQLQSSRGHPKVETQPPRGRLTMQGVGQHAGHALHHHLIGGLQESRRQALSPASLWNWHSWGAVSTYGGKPGPRSGVGLPQMTPVTGTQLPLSGSAAGSQARPHSS